MKKGILLVGFVIALLMLSGCIGQSYSYEEMVQCDSDSDCIIVNGRGCCACDTVINKKYEAYWNSRPVEQCPGRKCEMCPPSIKEAKCENKVCVAIYS